MTVSLAVRFPFEGSTPHPVPLPLGEGTVLHAPSVILASPLPWGEGQGEGRFPQYNQQPNDHLKTILRVAA